VTIRLAQAVPQRGSLAIAALVTLVLAAGTFGAWHTHRSNRRRRALLDDVALLQSALLPPVPERVGGLAASVAYRPWEGPGAGGDVYDVFSLPHRRAGVMLGDVAGHGRAVVGHTAALRHTLRAYLEAGLVPRAAIELAGTVLGRARDIPLATAILVVHDERAGTLTWASAGHPPPILLGAPNGPPAAGASAPPLAAGTPTGFRQTTVPFPAGSVACLFTDGLEEVPTADGRLGYARLTELAEELGDRLTGPTLLERVSAEATVIGDDMAVCVLRAVAGPSADAARLPRGRIEELALPAGHVSTSLLHRFLWACGVEADEAHAALSAAHELDRRGAGVLMRVETQVPAPVEVSELEATRLPAVG
jgi:hypothetical protein